MKIAIISPVNRIIIDEESIRSLEVTYLHKYLKSKYSCEVHYVSKKIKETHEDYIDIFTLDSLNGYDTLYLHNFNTNFFGGVVGKMTLKFLDLIQNFNGKIIYYITDPKLKFSNIAKDIIKRKNCKFEVEYDKSKLNDIAKIIDWQSLRMDALFTGYNYEPIYGVDFHNVTKYNVFNEIGKSFKLLEYNMFDENIIEFDCCYYGDNRGSHRNNKIKKYFNNTDIKTLLIGADLELTNNTHHKKVDHSKLETLVKKCHSSIVIGDKEHENAFVTMRFYENIRYDVVSFIDIDYDPNKTLFEDSELKEFNYIRSSYELHQKINTIKNDSQFKNKILTLQKNQIYGKHN